MNTRRSRPVLLALLLSSLTISIASAAIYYYITASMAFEVGWSPVAFTSGEDTLTCGGDLSNNASVSFSSIPLTIASNITITQLVNLTNTDGSDSHDVQISVSQENFGAELETLLLYVVSPGGSETLVVKLNGSGVVETENVQVTIPAGEKWAIKLIGCYEDGTSESQSNSMTLDAQVTS